MKTKYLIIAVSLFLTPVMHLANADDWSQWRGKDRTDVSTEKGLLQEWPDGGPKKLWTNEETGLGYAGFSIVGDRLFTLGLEDEMEFGLCLDTNTGKEIWRQEIGSKYKNNWGDGPRSTPTVDGEFLYCMMAGGTLACLKAADGSVVWSKTMEEFGGKVPIWGFAESPLIEGDMVVCTPGGEQGAIRALNKKTGETVWQTDELTQQAHYSSLIAADVHGKRQIIQQLFNAIVGLDAKTGKVLWQHEWLGRTAVIPTPIFHDNKVYVTTGYAVGCCQLEISQDNEVTEDWKNNLMQNHHGGVVYVNGFYFGHSDIERGTFVCQNPETGKAAWTEKPKLKKGSITYADGRFYMVQEGNGSVILFEADENNWTEKGRFKLEPQSKRRSPSGAIWVHPVVANGKLYVRDQEIICCYDVKAN